MSHNINKVNGSNPNREGNITQALEDLSNVNASSPNTGEVLLYSGGSWISSSASSATGGLINIGSGESNAYSNTGASSIGASSDLYFYDSNATNTITGSTINYVTSTNWSSSITLPAGDFMIWVRYGAEFSSTGYLGFAIYNSANTQLSSYAMIGADTTSYHLPPSVLQARLEITTNTTIKVRGLYGSGLDTVSNQGNTPAEFSQITILKV